MSRTSSGLRHRFGFWAIAYAFLVLFAFSTAPSPLYMLYARRDHFSSFMITLIYAAYAIGVLCSLFFISHLSDHHGRRPHLLAAVAFAIASDILFLTWMALPGLFLARILCGISVGLTVSTATAHLNELHQVHSPRTSRARPQLTAAVANLGGLAVGALLAGLLAQYGGHPLTIPYLVMLGMLVVAGIAVAVAPETRPRRRPLPVYRPQRVSVPKEARHQLFAALIGIFLAYASPALFLGLSGIFLATAVHDRSLAMAGGAIFIVFAVGVAMLLVTGGWPVRRLLVMGVVLNVLGLALVVMAAWLPTPSLALFLAGGGVIGAASAALFKGTLGSVVAISPADKLGEALAGFFLSGYIGLSLPVVAVGIALQVLSARATLLAFAIVVTAGVLGASRILLKAHIAPRLSPAPEFPDPEHPEAMKWRVQVDPG